MGWLDRFRFKQDTTGDQLRAATLTQQTITVPVKTPAYHEIVPLEDGRFIVRVYARVGGLLEESTAASREEAQRQALALLHKHNGGA